MPHNTYIYIATHSLRVQTATKVYISTLRYSELNNANFNLDNDKLYLCFVSYRAGSKYRLIGLRACQIKHRICRLYKYFTVCLILIK